jgi:HPt (histidine-containing phosphotransfer) domain-containing protein
MTIMPRLWIVRSNDLRREDDDCEVFDSVVFLRSIDGNLNLFQELAELFVSDCARRLAVADNALERQDSKALEIIAHSIRGSAAYLHAPAVYRAALTLETLARARDLTQTHEACADLVHEVARLIRVLSTQLSKLKSRPAVRHKGSLLRVVRPA